MDTALSPWYLRKPFVWLMILSILPFAIPLLLLSKEFSKVEKIILTILIIILTLFFIWLKIWLFNTLMDSQALTRILELALPPEQANLLAKQLTQLNKLLVELLY